MLARRTGVRSGRSKPISDVRDSIFKGLKHEKYIAEGSSGDQMEWSVREHLTDNGGTQMKALSLLFPFLII